MKAKCQANKVAKEKTPISKKTNAKPSLPLHLKALLDEVDREIAVNPSNPQWLQKLDPFNWPHLVYAHAALHGLISMGMRLNEEAKRLSAASELQENNKLVTIRSAWML